MPASLVVITANSLFHALPPVSCSSFGTGQPGQGDPGAPRPTGQPGLGSRPEHLSPSAAGARPLKGRLRSGSLCYGEFG